MAFDTDEYMQLIKDNIKFWDNNEAGFARHLATVMTDVSIDAHRLRIRRIKESNPEMLPNTQIDYNKHIPPEWNGTTMELARNLNRRFPEISIAGWENRVKRAKDRNSITQYKTPDFVVEQLKKANSSPEDLWAAIEKRSKEAILATEDARWATIHVNNSDRYIGIAFQSDQHIGNPFCDHERLRKDTAMIANNPDCYVIHAGDYIDNFIVDKPRPAMKAPIPPSIQWQLLEHYLNMTPDSIMAIVAGNHDLWTAGVTDYDPLKRLAKDRGILYHPYELNIKLVHGDIPYHLSIRHKRRGNSQIDPSRVIKKMWDDGECDFDVGVIGHNHVPTVVPFTRHAVERWAVRPGAYKIVDGFGEMCGFPRDRPTSPIIILSPHSRDIQAFTDLRHGLRLLNSLNGRDVNAYMDES